MTCVVPEARCSLASCLRPRWVVNAPAQNSSLSSVKYDNVNFVSIPDLWPNLTIWPRKNGRFGNVVLGETNTLQQASSEVEVAEPWRP